MNVHTSPNIIKVIKSGRVKWAKNIACTAATENVYKIVVENLERKRPLGRHEPRWENIIKMDITGGWKTLKLHFRKCSRICKNGSNQANSN
jgi:hypothetical protein